MKKILIPVDFSNNASNALQYAQILFENEECTFFLLNVYISNRSVMLSEEYNDAMFGEMLDESEHELDLLLKNIIKNNDNSRHQYNAISVSQSLVKAINNLLVSQKIDYIVMGTKGAKGAKEIFLGSNTVRVINEVNNCPIIVVPQNYMTKKPSLIAFSTNFKRAFFEEELKPLLEIVRSNNTQVNIARIMEEEFLTDKQKINKETIKTIFNGLDYIFCKIDMKTSETEALKEFAKQTKSDLISLVHHKYNFFQRFVEEDVVDRLSFNSPVPLLILPEKI